MLISMTGYGKAEEIRNGVKYLIELRSVNSRFSEVLLKCPKHIYTKEYEIREIIKQKISRGKISLLISLDTSDISSNASIVLDEASLKTQIDILKKIKKKFNSKEKIKLEHILSFSDYFLKDNEDAVDEEEFTLITKLIKLALEDLFEMKSREGAFLEKDILERIEVLDSESKKIAELSKERIQEEKRVFNEKLNVYLTDRNVIDEKRLEFELALLTERMDITEECVRLKSHIEFFRDSVNSNENVGRRLNFLLQEMNREINTIASKASDAVISQKVSLLKEELEKIREQIQNIE
ncbi:MAG: YicC family protein [Ignavibacteriae bacterium]|nr:YicC family protein [Ignavibacteriota bacterium]